MTNRNIYIGLILLGAVLFVPGLGLAHLFDWDEINFAEISREMLVSGNYSKVQVEFLPFWEKPPLFFWLQAGAMYLFGVNELAARLPNALAGMATLPILFYLGSRFYDRRFGWLWVLAYMGSFTPAVYFKSGIIDPIFNLFIFLSVFQLALWTEANQPNRFWHAGWGGLFMGLAILAKGPVALLLVGLCGLIYWVWSRQWQTFKVLELLVYGTTALAVASFWFLPEILQNGFWFLNEFIEYQIGLATKSGDTGHEQPFWYHPVVLLVGCFPASIFFLGALGKHTRGNAAQHNFKRWMQLQFWVTLVVFSIVKAKIIHYSSLCYFPLTFLATEYVYRIAQNELKWNRWLNGALGLVGGLWAVVLLVLPMVNQLKPHIIPLIADPFAVANLQAEVVWQGWEVLIGLGFGASLIYSLWNNQDILTKAGVLYVGSLITLQLILYILIPKVERYSQGAMIDFLKSVQAEDCYISPVGYHSYAHHFYGTVTPAQAKRKLEYLTAHFGKNSLGKQSYSQQKDQWNEWLLRGEIDRPAYLLTKVGNDFDFGKYPDLKKVLDKNGFVVYKRAVKK
ncbi:MAG: glycosyltransferase family 39 protein [Microscillaceae bacterium]|jgi:4-amino-4-deoxy-L-arabinose transferase-like glycosyltransferase|nr:glycosyltransferase family 39 protein [Microscillaceae bacterium]